MHTSVFRVPSIKSEIFDGGANKLKSCLESFEVECQYSSSNLF